MIRKSYSTKPEKFSSYQSTNISPSLSLFTSPPQTIASQNLLSLQQELSMLKEEEQRNLDEISDLEKQQLQFYQERQSFIINYKKAKTRSRQSSDIVIQLQDSIEQLTDSFSDAMSNANQEKEKLKTSIKTNNAEIAKEKVQLQKSVNELNKLQSIHQTNQNSLGEMKSRYQQLQKESEILRTESKKNKKEIRRYNQKMDDFNTESESENETNVILTSQFNDLQEKVEQLNQTKRLIQKREKEKLHFDENDFDQILLRTKECIKEYKQYENEIFLKEDELSNLQYQIERFSKELDHLLAAQQERRNRRLFLEQNLTD